MRELRRLLVDLGQQRLDRIVFVTHSLGTVVFTDMLREAHRQPAQSTYPPIDLVTAGSPLRRLIGRLLPTRLGTLPELRRELGAGEGPSVARWFNVYRLFDYVGQALTYSFLVPLPRRRRGRDPVDGIAERLLAPWPVWQPLAHSDYWGDPRFLRFLADEVLYPVRPKNGSDR